MVNFGKLNRRDFVKGRGAAGLASLTVRAPRAFGAEKVEKSKPRADAMILLFMAGGRASTETVDPKHYEPFVPGGGAKKVLSTFPAIPTSLDGGKISEGLANVAQVMERCALLPTVPAASRGRI